MNDRRDIKDSILNKIKGGEIKMRPRCYFILKAVLVFGVACVLTLSVLYLLSFIIFFLQQTGIIFTPIFGWRGTGAFFASLPWSLISIALALILLIEVLLSRYTFAYRQPLLLSLSVLIFLVVIGSVGVSKTSFHDEVFRYANRGYLSVAGDFYRGYIDEQRFLKIHPGLVATSTNDGFWLKTRRGEVIRIIISPKTRFPWGTDFDFGDRVVVFGDRDNGVVEALGINRLDEKVSGNSKSLYRLKFLDL